MDGHYWIERNGVIEDPYFSFYDSVKSIWGLTDEIVYLEASPAIQAVFIKKLMDTRDIVDYMSQKQLAQYRPNNACCTTNAVVAQKLRGGRIVFGSMGWKRKNGNGIHYEFGGENYTVKQFLNK
jgi:hypothetical protein